MLVTGEEILQDAHKNNYAIGAFNVNNMEIIQAIMEAAEETNSPVILQASQGGLEYAGIEYIAELGKLAARKAAVPVALHLDHGTDFSQVMLCIRHGFTSVMIDGSRFNIEDNINITKKVIEAAHSVGVSVEAELGKIGNTENNIDSNKNEFGFTVPKDALKFVRETSVDYLAVAVGTAHGVYNGEPNIDFSRIKAIKDITNIPLVLHGSSGVPNEAIEKAVLSGINKINIDTDLRMAFTNEIKKIIEKKPNNIDPRKMLNPARKAMKEVIKEKMYLFGSSNRA